MHQPRFRRKIRSGVTVKLSRCLLPVAAIIVGTVGPLDAATATWDGNSAVGVVGDGVNWTNPNNWTTNGVVDSLPPNTLPGDDLTFGGGTVGTINLQGNEFANSLTFTAGQMSNRHS